MVRDPRRHPKWYDLKSRLLNYKQQQADVAKKKGVSKELAEAKTLTQARRIVYGVKRKNVR